MPSPTTRLRRDAVLAVRPRWREGVGLAMTGLLVLSVPLSIAATMQVAHRMDQIAAAADTLEAVAPRTAALAEATADVTRRVGEIAIESGPQLADVTDQVDEVARSIADTSAELRPVTEQLDQIALIARLAGGDDVADGVLQVQDALRTVDATVQDVAGATTAAADQIDALTSPESLAALASAADTMEGLADVSRRAGDLAQGYASRADTYRALAQVLAVVGLIGMGAWLVWRVREHRRWLVLRRRDAATAVLGAIAGSALGQELLVPRRQEQLELVG